MNSSNITILHYSAPPIIGGVEAVIEAHAKVFQQEGYSTSVIAGRGKQEALASTRYKSISMIDSQHPDILRLSAELEAGRVPNDFAITVDSLVEELAAGLRETDHLMVHNIFTKHFNLPLTAALHRLLDGGFIKHAIAWCHDMSWTSPSSRSKVHAGYPWDLLRTRHDQLTYVVVSKSRQRELAKLFNCPLDQIEVIYNGVDPIELMGLSKQGRELINRLRLLESDLNLLMPVRVTKAKNIEYAMGVLSSLKAHFQNPKLVLTGPPDPHDSENMDYYHALLDQRRVLGLEDQMKFVFESGPDPEQPFTIDWQVVGDLYRVSDVMFMPSHREGFGMPILEAGLLGLLIVSTDIPASSEIAKEDCYIFDPSKPEEEIAEQIFQRVQNNSISRMRRLVRTNYTWKAIFKRKIKPLLDRR
jgi:glycosyltransferase involved in cell wall biosynthesis